MMSAYVPTVSDLERIHARAEAIARDPVLVYHLLGEGVRLSAELERRLDSGLALRSDDWYLILR